MNPYLYSRLEALRCLDERPRVTSVELPMKLVSWANGRGASRGAAMAKAEKVKAQRAAGVLVGRKFRSAAGASSARFLVVHLVRVAPRMLDSDNLEGAFKALRDGIAMGLEIDDRSDAVHYLVSQTKGAPKQHLVRVELYLEPAKAVA